MDPNDWKRLKQLFNSALEYPPGERGTFLAQACAGNQSLRAEVESLLASHDKADTSAVLVGEFSDTAERALQAADPMIGCRLGPYQIVRQVGHGGMAVIYLGMRVDDQYQKRVAVKVVTPGLDNEQVMRRFRNERQTLAALDHPNIVKLLDGGSTQEGLPYLVMDYVEGATIDEYCDTHRLPTAERLHLFQKVCAAVYYAHLNLVVHRDLKPGNILVTADGTPKLLDFGIAKLLNPEFARTMLMTQANLRLMTPEYASPEQVRGEPITPASDVYSLGVILYELLSGHRPYRLKVYTPLEMEKLICEQEPERPSVAVTRCEEIASAENPAATVITPERVSQTREGDPGRLRRRLHGDLDVIVLKALRKEPNRRYTSVKEFSDDIERHLQHLPIKARPSTSGYRTGKFLRRHKEAALAAVISLALLGSLLAWQMHWRVAPVLTSKQSAASKPIKIRPSVAVLGFRNLSGHADVDWLSTALSEMLATELAVGEKLRTVPGENVARMKKELALGDADALARDSLLRVRANGGADFVVLGSYVDLGRNAGGKVRFDLRLQDAAVGETVAAVTETGTEANLFDLVSRAGTEVRDKLGVGEVTAEQAEKVKATLPATPGAERLYAQGLSKLRVYDALGARELLAKAVELDPSYGLAHSALATAWSQLGYDQKAKDEAQKAFQSSGNLSREYRLSIEGQYRETTKDWGKATEIYRSLYSFFPDNLEYGLRLANAQIAASAAKDALVTIESLRKLPAPARDDARIDLAEGLAANTLSDYKRQQSAAHQAAEKGAASGARLLVAQAEILQGSASWNLAQLDKAGQAYTKAKDIASQVGDPGTMARALQNMGNVLGDQGKISEAREYYGQALSTYQRLGNERGVAAILGNLGILLTDNGDLAGARKMLERSLSAYREIGDKPSLANQLNNTAVVLQKLGDDAGAMKMYEEALAIDRTIDNKRQAAMALNNIAGMLNSEGHLAAAKAKFEEALAVRRQIGSTKDVGIALVNLAEVAVNQGELSDASRMLQEALALFRDNGYKSGAAYALFDLGNISSAQGDLSAARASYHEALEIRNEIGEKATALEAQVALAQLSIDEGHPNEAISPLKEARAAFQQEKNIDDEVFADTTLALALLGTGLNDQAEQAISEGARIAAKSSDAHARLDLEIARGRVLAAAGRSADARATLHAALSRAHKIGFIGDQLEARFALAEMEAKLHNAKADQQALRNLQDEAKAKGYELIARKAAALTSK